MVERLTWRSALQIAGVHEDRATMATTFTYLFGIGGALLVGSLLLPGAADRSAPALVAVAVAAYVIAATFLVVFDRLPIWFFRISPALGTTLVTLAVYFGGDVAAAAYGMYYFWVALAACYFLRPQIAAAHLGLACAAYGAALIAGANVPVGELKWLMASGTLLVTGVVMTALRRQTDRLLGRLASAARTDALTGLANRRALEDRFEIELERAARSGRPLAIVVLDLDWFKEFNDRFGHSAGDQALAQLGAAQKRATRAGDLVARLGGEEFAVLAPETDEHEGHKLAERLRTEVKEAFTRQADPLTVSCGVASFPVHGLGAGELLHAADRALYEAKETGRDRSVVYSVRDAAGESEDRPRIERTSPRLLSLVSLAEAVDRRKGSPANSRRVADYAEALGRTHSLPDEEVERLRVAALLRDVGEVGVPESILNKPGPLSQEERRELERHPEIGARIVGAAQLGRVGEWILTHHERPNGSGYPRGLRGPQIPLAGRILAVADAYAAMTADRPYRGPLSDRQAKRELQAMAGSQFDHDVVDAFLSLNGELETGNDVAARAA